MTQRLFKSGHLSRYWNSIKAQKGRLKHYQESVTLFYQVQRVFGDYAPLMKQRGSEAMQRFCFSSDKLNINYKQERATVSVLDIVREEPSPLIEIIYT